LKQSKLRRRRVIRYAILYFVLLVVFLALIVGPIVAGKHIPASTFKDVPMNLMQPAHQDNDDTRGRTETGTKSPGYTGIGTKYWTTTDTAAAVATSVASSAVEKLRLF
jgi:1,3-beta-glucan synthase